MRSGDTASTIRARMNIDYCRICSALKAKIETHSEFKIATVKASFEPICLQALPSTL